MPEVLFQMLVLNGDFTLEPCLKSILPFGKIIVAEGPVGHYIKQGFTTSTDRTNEILSDLVGEKNVIHGNFSEKDEMMNAVLHLIPDDTQFLFMVDCDEIWRAEDLKKIFDLLDSGNYDSMSFKANSFYAGFGHRMTGFEENFEVHRIQRWYPGARWATHRPPTILAPDGRPWREHRHLNHDATDRMGLRFFHYSYVLPSIMKHKASYYHEMSPRGTIEGYFENVYLPWILGDDEQKARVELEFRGVHDWIPERRGDCYTIPFKGKHPEEIEKVLPQMKQRIANELSFYKQ